MNIIGNIIWFLVAGLVLGIAWAFAGLVLCITIVGIPFGIQCFKIARLSLFPFGKVIVYGNFTVIGFIGNLLWLLIFGLWLALVPALIGLLFCITIIGIPFGIRCFKLAKLAFMPFGSTLAS